MSIKKQDNTREVSPFFLSQFLGNCSPCRNCVYIVTQRHKAKNKIDLIEFFIGKNTFSEQKFSLQSRICSITKFPRNEISIDEWRILSSFVLKKTEKQLINAKLREAYLKSHVEMIHSERERERDFFYKHKFYLFISFF